MIKPNKYLRELGIEFFGYEPEGENEEFDSREFYNLDLTLDMILYSRLACFREKYADAGVPSRFDSQEDWYDALDKVLAGLKLALTKDFPTLEEQDTIYNARILLADIWPCLWI
jgi:hypothetical protein